MYSFPPSLARLFAPTLREPLTHRAVPTAAGAHLHAPRPPQSLPLPSALPSDRSRPGCSGSVSPGSQADSGSDFVLWGGGGWLRPRLPCGLYLRSQPPLCISLISPHLVLLTSSSREPGASRSPGHSRVLQSRQCPAALPPSPPRLGQALLSSRCCQTPVRFLSRVRAPPISVLLPSSLLFPWVLAFLHYYFLVSVWV